MSEQKNTQQPVAWVVYNGWRKELPFLTEEAARDFVAAEQLHADLSGNLAAYRIAPTYTAPPVPRDVLMAFGVEVANKAHDAGVICNLFTDDDIAALADSYASQVQPEPVNQQLLAALEPFAKAHETWNGGNAPLHFSTAAVPAHFRRAAYVYRSAIAAAEAAQPVDSERDAELREALNIANYLWRNFYAAEAPHWQPLDTVRGLLTQIDNMVAGIQQPASAQPVAVPDELSCDDIERLRMALSWEGYSTPEGLENCAARWPELVRDLIRAVLRRKERARLSAAPKPEGV